MSMKKLFNLTERKAMVTCVRNGLGRLLVLTLAEAGTKVVLCEYCTGQLFVVDGA